MADEENSPVSRPDAIAPAVEAAVESPATEPVEPARGPVAFAEAKAAAPRKRAARAPAAVDAPVIPAALAPAPAIAPVAAAPKSARKAAAKPRVAPAPRLPRKPAPVKAGKPAAGPAMVAAAAKSASPRIATPARKPIAAPRVPPVTPAMAPATGTAFVSEIFPMTTDFTEMFKTTFADVQDKAKAAYEQGAAKLGEAGAIAKGNVEAVVESGKILAEGLQKLGTTAVADSREAFEGLTAEVKELAAAKSPTDFFKLQSEMMKKQLDSMLAYGTRQSEAMMKLSTDAFAPISRRVTLAVESIKTAA